MNILFPLIGYLAGSLPFSVWITRFAKGVDVRDGGSGHAGATNTIRQAGFGWGALVFLLDALKGFLPLYFAIQLQLPDVVLILTAALAVLGHCFPVFAQFRGGMGLAAAAGCLLALNPLSFLICVALLILILLIVRHAARATVFAAILSAPALWLAQIRDVTLWTAAALGAVIALRFLVNWNRKYRELWLDREKKSE